MFTHTVERVYPHRRRKRRRGGLRGGVSATGKFGGAAPPQELYKLAAEQAYDKQQRAFLAHWDRMQQVNAKLEGIASRARTARAALNGKPAPKSPEDAEFSKLETAYNNLAAHPELLNSPTTLAILHDTRARINEIRMHKGLEPLDPLPKEEE